MELKIRNGDYIADGIGGERRADGAEARRREAAWRQHATLERGNPVRTYRGMGFSLDG